MHLIAQPTRILSTRLVVASTLVVSLLSACGWVESTGVPDQPGPLLLGLSDDSQATQVDLTAGSQQSVDLSVLRRDLGVEESGVTWRHTGAGNIISCSAITNRTDVSTSLMDACDRSQYDGTTNNASASTAGSISSEPDSCSIFIVETNADTIGSRAAQSIFDIHTPALESPVALAYTIDFTQQDGMQFSYPVNLCIQP